LSEGSGLDIVAAKIGVFRRMSDRTRVGIDRLSVKRLGSSLFVSLLLIAGLSRAAYAAEIVDRFPNETWDSVDATQLGWSADLMADAREWSKTIGSSAVMVIQHGVVVAEWGDTQKRMELASVRKSFLSALIGNAVARNQIDLADPIGMLGIDDNAPSLTPEEKSASIGDLLKARSGVYHPALYETPSMAAQRPARGSHLPGTFWYYNNWDFNTLGAIYLQETGSSVFDALDREIAKPIGMQDYRPADGAYFTGAASVYPAYPIRMSARDLARFALLYLHDGRWKDRQIVPAQWVHDSVGLFEVRLRTRLWLFVVDRFPRSQFPKDDGAPARRRILRFGRRRPICARDTGARHRRGASGQPRHSRLQGSEPLAVRPSALAHSLGGAPTRHRSRCFVVATLSSPTATCCVSTIP
jgi:CubicO group peptidase (beta-lactamase class C family)